MTAVNTRERMEVHWGGTGVSEDRADHIDSTDRYSDKINRLNISLVISVKEIR